MKGSPLEDLSGRQLEVLDLICQGFPSSLIGKKLNISFETVKSHRTAIMRRWGVSNTVELVNKYHDIKSERHPPKIRTETPYLLVVEDDIDFRELMVSSLRGFGFECNGVGNREELESALSARMPDIIILDLNLGQDDGLDIAKNLRASSACGIVMMTTRGMIESRIDGLAIGADAYLVKPVDIRELTAVLKNLYVRLHPPPDAVKP